MGVVEDIRQVIQDLVAPQLMSLDARMSALDARMTSIEASITQRFASSEAVANARHDALTAQIAQLATIVATNHSAILQKLDLEKRIDALRCSRLLVMNSLLCPRPWKAANRSA